MQSVIDLMDLTSKWWGQDSKPSHSSAFPPGPHCFLFPWTFLVVHKALTYHLLKGFEACSLPPASYTDHECTHRHTHTCKFSFCYIYNGLGVKKLGWGVLGRNKKVIKGIGLMIQSSQLSQKLLRIFSNGFYKQTIYAYLFLGVNNVHDIKEVRGHSVQAWCPRKIRFGWAPNFSFPSFNLQRETSRWF